MDNLCCNWCGHDKHISECGWEEMDNVDGCYPTDTCMCGQNSVDERLVELRSISRSFETARIQKIFRPEMTK